jgi:hypothetical protein
MNDVLKIYSLSERNDKYEGCTSDSIYGTSNCISRTIKMIDHLIFKTISFLLQKIVCKLDMMADECFSVERRYIYICLTWWHTVIIGLIVFQDMYLKLQFKYFLAQVFLVIAFVYLVPEMYSCCVLFENIIEMRVFNVFYLWKFWRYQRGIQKPLNQRRI